MGIKHQIEGATSFAANPVLCENPPILLHNSQFQPLSEDSCVVLGGKVNF
jgi:hypothetical protein